MTENWRAQANCAGYEDVYDRLADTALPGSDLKLARSICGACPVAAECLKLALAVEGTSADQYRHGVFAGTTPVQRARIAGRHKGYAYSAEEKARRAAKDRARRLRLKMQATNKIEDAA